MKKPPYSSLIEARRIVNGEYASKRGDACGAFILPAPWGGQMCVVVSDGVDPVCQGWEHVSVSFEKRAPSWREMHWVKRQFWTDDECVIQFHPPQSVYVNCHPHCLHLWRSNRQAQAYPPPALVGPT